MYELEPLADGDCGFISLQFFQAFLNPPDVAPLTTIGMRRFLHETLENDPEYFSTSTCIATMMQRNWQITQQQWLDFSLEICLMDLGLQT
jgi:hypothetical protein